MPQQRVLILASRNPQLYGSAKMLSRLLRCWPSGDLAPLLVAPAEGPLLELARSRAIPVEVIPGLDGANLRKAVTGYVPALRRLSQLVRSNRPGVLLAQNRRMLVATAPVSLRYRIPRVWQIGLGFDSPANRWINRACVLIANRVVLESDHQADTNFGAGFRRMLSSRFRIVPKGIDVDGAFEQAPAGRTPSGTHGLLVGTLASISRRKGHDVLLRAAAGLGDALAEVRIGGEPHDERDRRYREELVELAAGRSDGPAVRFCGFVDDVGTFLGELDLFVLASRNEGISGAAREAMLCGLPVVATDVGGMRTVIDHGRTGLLVPPDDVSALRSALLTLAADPALRRTLGLAARAHILQHYDPRLFAKRYCETFQELADLSI